jgi:KaiC/GvpD/RAD55 family RecA-like ATPase
MIIHLSVIDPLLLAPVAFGLLTIFGRGKKKDDKDDEGYETNKASSSSQNTTPQTPTPSPAPTASPSPYGPYNTSPSPGPRSSSEEETSLNKLLQSLLQDMPFNPPGQNESSSSGMTSTADWVPPRSTPRSRPMVLAQGDKELTPMRPEENPAQAGPVSKPVQPEQKPVPEAIRPPPSPPVQTQFAKPLAQTPVFARQFIPTQNPTVENVQTPPLVRPFIPEQNTTPATPRPTQPNVQPQIAPFRPPLMAQPQPTVQPQTPTVRPQPSMQPQPPVQLHPSRTEPEDEEVKTPSKPVKMEKAEVKQEPLKKASATTPQTFDHIFDVTQGTLRTPGLVIINGPAASGKTSLASNLAGAYLKSGTPCLLVTYDQSPSSLRDTIKKAGWDAQQFESQYKLVMVDGFSGQSDMMSFEPYYVEKPFDMDALGQTLTSNTQIFMGDKIAIIFDSVTGLASHVPSKEFLAKFQGMLEQLKGSAVTLVVTLDITQLSKDVTGPLEDQANCVIDLSKDGQNGQLKVRKLNGNVSKSDPEEFEIEAGKGVLFV